MADAALSRARAVDASLLDSGMKPRLLEGLPEIVRQAVNFAASIHELIMDVISEPVTIRTNAFQQFKNLFVYESAVVQQNLAIVVFKFF